MSQLGMFDIQDRLESLSKAGDPLVTLNEKIDWDQFHKPLQKAMYRDRKSNAGRKPYSTLLMFKILILQSLYNLSDEQMEFMIRDRLSFLRFLGLTFEGNIPDQKTIWHYREVFTNAKVLKILFDRFNRMLDSQGLHAAKGTLIDASIVEVPKQRNSREENEIIKKGEIPKEWSKPKAEPKLRQKDTDARWVTKNGKNSYGYKMHINADNKHKLIRKVEVTSANVHDSNVFETLFSKNNSKDIWADSAYSHKRHTLPKGYRSHIHRKSVRSKKLSTLQEKLNHVRSKVRCRVEHVFGFVKGKIGLFVRSIGKKRAEARIILASLTYNMYRSVRLA